MGGDTVGGVDRRRVLLALGGVSLGGAAVSGLRIAWLTAEPPAHGALAEGRAVAVGRAADAGLPVAHAVASQQVASYPLDRPLYRIRDAGRAIALTIDDGPSPVYTPQVLRLLERYQVTATFCMVGLHVAAYPQLARAVAEAGHQIANHTWAHVNVAVLPSGAVRDQMTRASDAIEAAAGIRPALFRAPYGTWSPVVLAQCQQLRMIPLDWSVDPRDWSRPGVQAITRNIMTNTQPGSIILEHDGGGNRSETVAALGIVLPRLLAEGYRFQTP